MLFISLAFALIGKRIFENLKIMKTYNSVSMKFFELFLYSLTFNLFILTFSLSNYVAKLKVRGVLRDQKVK